MIMFEIIAKILLWILIAFLWFWIWGIGLAVGIPILWMICASIPAALVSALGFIVMRKF